MESPPPDMSPRTLSMMNIIVPDSDSESISDKDEEKSSSGSSSNLDFSGDDTDKDPNYVPVEDIDRHNSCDEDIEDNQPHNDVSAENWRDLPSNSSFNDSEISSPKITKKRQKHTDLWKCNINKKLRQAGKEYNNWKNQPMPARAMKPACKHTCFFLCTKNFSEADRIKIFDNFWNLSDDDKIKFYFKFVKRENIKRRRVASEAKKYSFKFFLQVNDIIFRVCRLFFLNTINITKRRIYYCFENFTDNETGCPRAMKRGKNVKRITTIEKLNEVRDHIKSFKTIDSHYCRASTQKLYLETDLNLSKMYQLYLEKNNDPNKINTTAIKIFLDSHSNLEFIIQKFSEPGHSNIQEVDCVHSTIDRYLKNIEIHSPLHYVRLLHNMKATKVTLVILQMKPTDFKIYSNPAGKLDYSRVPFSKIKSILYEKEAIGVFTIKYKITFQEINYKTISLHKKASKKILATPKNLFSTAIAKLPERQIAREKISDLKDLFPFLPTEDVKYFTASLKINQK